MHIICIITFILSLPLDFIIAWDFNIPLGNVSSDAVAINSINNTFLCKFDFREHYKP